MLNIVFFGGKVRMASLRLLIERRNDRGWRVLLGAGCSSMNWSSASIVPIRGERQRSSWMTHVRVRCEIKVTGFDDACRNVVQVVCKWTIANIFETRVRGIKSDDIGGAGWFRYNSTRLRSMRSS